MKKKYLSMLLFAVCLVSTGWLIWNLFSYRSGGDAYSDARALARQSVRETQPPSAAEAPVPADTQPRMDWVPAPIEEDPNLEALEQMDIEALRQVNGDVVGWIQIPGTEVDYPLVQGQDNDFYLEHDWQGTEQYVGSIFLECQNSPDFTDFNTIVYGHNMTDGSMFGSLWKYQYGENWKENPYIYVVLDSGILRYEVFSTYEAEVDSETYRLGIRRRQTKAEYLAMTLENSDIDTGILPELTDRVITLSTCSGMGHSVRRVVHARLRMVETAAE